MGKIVQYLWIERNYCFEKQEFNFSSEYDIHYDEENNQLKITKNSKYISNFYEKNIDITAVVGKNGTGKTSLLNYISSINYYNILYPNIHGNCIIIFKENHILKVFCNSESPEIIKRDIECDCETIKLINRSNDKNIFISNDYFKDIRYEYFTTVLNKSVNFNSEDFGGYINLSTYKALKNNNKDTIDTFFLDEFSKQIKFFSANKEKITNFGINYPLYVTVWFNNNQYGLEEICMRAEQAEQTGVLDKEECKKYIDSLIKLCFPRENDSFELIFKVNIAFSMTLSIINRLIKIGLDKLDCNQILSLIHSSFNKLQNSDPLGPFDKLKEFLSNIEDKFCFPTKNHKEFIDYIEKNISFNDTADLFHLQTSRFTMSVEKGQNKYVVDVDASLIEFVQKYRATIDEDDYLRFEWDLSSGEMLLLTAYARFYDDKTKNTNSNIKNRIVLLDEAEVSFHPEWQRIYLSNMLKFFKDLYNNCHVQLIIATHSPIILSDIPKQNIIYLSKDEKGNTKVDSINEHEETFGANIYTLYNNAFFMNNGAVGEFAREYISKIKNAIDNSSKSYEEIENNISIIGDEFIRNQLYLYLNQKKKAPKNNIDKLLKQMDQKEKEELFELLSEQLK